MRSRASSKLGLAVVAVVIALGCASKTDHPPSAGECGNDPNCRGLGGGGGGGGNGDTGVAADGTPATDGGPVTFALSGDVRTLAGFPSDPSKSPITTNADLNVHALNAGTPISVPVSSGTFAIPAVTATPELGWVSLFGTHDTRALTIQGFVVEPTTTAVTLPIASISQDLVDQWALFFSSGADGGIITTAGRATLVLQITDTSDVPRAGVVAFAHARAEGPFYDDGADGLIHGTSTGTHGTFVYLGIDVSDGGAAFGDVSFTLPNGGPTLALRPLLAANAVTFLRLPTK